MPERPRLASVRDIARCPNRYFSRAAGRRGRAWARGSSRGKFRVSRRYLSPRPRVCPFRGAGRCRSNRPESALEALRAARKVGRVLGTGGRGAGYPAPAHPLGVEALEAPGCRVGKPVLGAACLTDDDNRGRLLLG